jgi:hypothetical protein
MRSQLARSINATRYATTEADRGERASASKPKTPNIIAPVARSGLASISHDDGRDIDIADRALRFAAPGTPRRRGQIADGQTSSDAPLGLATR